MKKSASAWPRSRGSTPTAPRRCGTIVRSSPPAHVTPATAEANPERDAAVERLAASQDKPEREAKAERPLDSIDTIWEVKQADGRRGLVVYESKGEGALVAGQLRAGARLREIATEGPFLHFRKLLGHGPEFGWVRMRLDGEERVERLGRPREDTKAAVPRSKAPPAAPDPRAVAKAGSEPGGTWDASAPLQGAVVWIVALGDRGDVQPLIALGAQLRRAGSLVRVFGPAQFETLAESSELSFCPIGVGVWAFWSASEELWAIEYHEAFRIWVERDLCTSTRAVLTELEAGQPDLVITNHFCVNVAAVAVKTYSVPALLVHVRVDPFPTELQTAGLSYCDFLHIEDVCVRWRADASTPGRRTSCREWREFLDSLPFLVASTQLITSGLRYDQQEAAKTMAFVGNLVIEEQRPLGDPAIFGSSNELKRLQAFLGRVSSPPVYVGWGGAVCDKGPAHMIHVVGLALVAAGKPAVVVTGRSGISLDLFEAGLHVLGWQPHAIAQHVRFLEKNAIFIEAVPHEWLFMRCICTVHHGGAGTTAAALRAGVPMIVTPIKSQHLHFACWVNALGTGIGFDKTLDDISVDELKWCLDNATESKKRAKAREIGRTVRKEDGDNAALGHIRNIIRDARSGAISVRGESESQPRAEAPPQDPRSAEEASLDELRHQIKATQQSGKVWILTFAVPEEHSFLALGAQLRKAGYAVTFFGRAAFSELAYFCDLDFVEIAPGLDEVMQRPDAIEALSSDPYTSEEFLWSWLEGALPAAIGPVLAAMGAGTPDVIVLDRRSLGIGFAAQRMFGVQLLLAHPWAPFDVLQEPDRECICTYAAVARALSWDCPVPEKDWWAYVTSPHNTLVSLPTSCRDGIPPELQEWVQGFAFTGFWTLGCTLPSVRSEEEQLKAFMAENLPTALVAWGDSICHSRAWMVCEAATALRFAGFRGVIVQGTASLDMELLRSTLRESGDPSGVCSYAEANIMFVKAYPPAWLLRSCLCAVHHGGATITGATLHAGLPSILTPFVGDQFTYTTLLEGAGVGRSMGDLRNLTHAALTRCLRNVGFSESMHQLAASYSESMQKDLGAQAAVAFITKAIQTWSGVG